MGNVKINMTIYDQYLAIYMLIRVRDLLFSQKALLDKKMETISAIINIETEKTSYNSGNTFSFHLE